MTATIDKDQEPAASRVNLNDRNFYSGRQAWNGLDSDSFSTDLSRGCVSD